MTVQNYKLVPTRLFLQLHINNTQGDFVFLQMSINNLDQDGAANTSSTHFKYGIPYTGELWKFTTNKNTYTVNVSSQSRIKKNHTLNSSQRR